MGNDLEKIPSSSPETSDVIDAEFEVKSEPTKTEAEPVRISPEEQVKLDKTLHEAEVKQTREDEEYLKTVKEALEKKFREGNQQEKKENPRKASKKQSESKDEDSLDEVEIVSDDEKYDSTESDRKEWIKELRTRIKRQEDIVQKAHDEFIKAEKELGAIENRSWYKNLLAGDPFGIMDFEKKSKEVESRRRYFQGVDNYRISLKDQLEDAIKKNPGWR